MSAVDSSARAPSASSAAPVPSAVLAGLLRQLPGACWIALVGDRIDGWPATVAPPRGARELARQAVGSGRVARLALGPRTKRAELDELIAVPAGALALLVGIRDADDGARREIVRRALAMLAGKGAVSGMPPRTPPATTVGLAAATRTGTGAEGGSSDVAAPHGGAIEGAASVRASAPAGSAAGGPTDAAAPVRAAALAPAVLEAAAEHGGESACALALADSLVGLGGCARVSVGARRRGRARLLAISGEACPDRRRALTRRLEAVMAETFACGRDTLWPLDRDREGCGSGGAPERPVEASLHAHRHQHTREGLALCSLTPAMPSGERLVVVFEHDPSRRPDAPWRAATALAIRPSLMMIARLGRTRATSLARLGERLRTAFGARAGRPMYRLGAVVLGLGVLAAVAFLPQPYRISARVIIEASDRQVLVAPHAGHLRSAHARAGDSVSAGQLLATLDERELVLARDKWEGEATRNRAEQARALATRDRVELARLRADAVRIEAERALIEERRARGELRAPFDGIVLSGDPARTLGAPVETGEVLFEVASSDRRSLLVEIDEHDIALVPHGGVARVRMAAAPRRVLVARLGTVVPVAVAEPGGSVFRVPATLADDTGGEALRPGMQGVARVEAGRRTLAGAWTRELRERALLLLWKLGLAR